MLFREKGYALSKVMIFYNNLKELLQEHVYPARRTFNMDKSGL
jgi:hypothetical protein